MQGLFDASLSTLIFIYFFYVLLRIVIFPEYNITLFILCINKRDARS